MNSHLKLNLGCGFDHRPGWVNIDAVPETSPDLIHDLLQPLPFADGSADEVLAQDILEHFTYEDVDTVLREVARVLTIGGKLHIRIPSVDQIITQFADQPWTRNHFLYGNTAETGVFGAHKVGYTPQVLLVKMMRLGLRPETFQTVETNYEATFVRVEQKKRPMKIVFVNQTLGIGGAETFNADLLAAFHDQGHQVQAYTTNRSFATMLHARGISTKHLPVILDFIGDWKGLIKAVVHAPAAALQYGMLAYLSRTADVALLTGFPEKIAFTPFARLFRIPTVWVEFSPLTPVFKKFLHLPKLLYRSCKDLPDAIVVPTNYTRQYLVPEARLDLEKVQIIPCGRQDVSAQKHKKIATHKQSHTIVCVSRMEHGKGQEFLLEALPELLMQFADARLIFVGEGEMLSVMQQKAEAMGLSRHVEFLGFAPDAIQVMNQARVCVFPSMWPLEGFGMVMIEAMALGKPVVAFGRGPALEILHHQRNGLLAKPGDAQDLARQIAQIFTDSQLEARIIASAKQDFCETYEIGHVATAYVKLFEDVMLRRQATAFLSR